MKITKQEDGGYQIEMENSCALDRERVTEKSENSFGTVRQILETVV